MHRGIYLVGPSGTASECRRAGRSSRRWRADTQSPCGVSGAASRAHRCRWAQQTVQNAENRPPRHRICDISAGEALMSPMSSRWRSFCALCTPTGRAGRRTRRRKSCTGQRRSASVEAVAGLVGISAPARRPSRLPLVRDSLTGSRREPPAWLSASRSPAPDTQRVVERADARLDRGAQAVSLLAGRAGIRCVGCRPPYRAQPKSSG